MAGLKNEFIHSVDGFHGGGYTYVPVVIVGAGHSGIVMGCRLKEKLGFDQFRIYDRQAGIGGTWWINRYPGVACDVPAVFYSYSFCPNPNWTAFHPSGEEIYKYLHGVIDKYQIGDKFQLDTSVDECRWSDAEQLWTVTLRHLVHGMGDLSTRDCQDLIDRQGESAVYLRYETVKCRVLVSGVGGLVEPKDWPADIPGLDEFQGQIFHSARWDQNVDFTDKNVVVVGTGCSAAQFVPRLTKAPYNARSVTQLMRSPPWVVPRAQPPGGDGGWSTWAPWVFNNVPLALRLMRTLVFCITEYDWRLFTMSAWSQRERAKLEARLLDHMKQTTPEKYHRMLTPNYSVACKRRIFDATWLPGLNDPKIDLTTMPLARLNATSVVLNTKGQYPPAEDDALAPGEADPAAADSPERELPADIIVLANGFQTTKFMHPLRVHGRTGEDIVDVMEARGGVQAYQGTAMDGFPNFFFIFGPNTATGHSSVILAIENMVEHALPFIRTVLAGEATTVEVKEAAERAYTTRLQRELKDTVFLSGGCQSWYNRADGWNSTTYPRTQLHFAYRCLFPRYRDWHIAYTRTGLLRNGLRRTARLLLLALVASLLLRLRRAGLPSLVAAAQTAVRTALGHVESAAGRARRAL